MNKWRRVILISSFSLLAMALTTTGSNRGFVIHIPLTHGYDNIVSLPYNTQYSSSRDIFLDIPNCTRVCRWDTTLGDMQCDAGGRTPQFNLVQGEALKIVVSQDTTWLVVGSHNNTAQVQLYKIPKWAGDVKDDWNWIEPPYHTRATTAAELFQEIPNCQRVSRLNNAQGVWERWDGTNQPPDNVNFAITPGEGYTSNVSEDCTWTPSHY